MCVKFYSAEKATHFVANYSFFGWLQVATVANVGKWLLFTPFSISSKQR